MTNLALATREPATLAETKELATIFHQSGLFTDIKQSAQAMVKIIAGRELGFGPLASMNGIYIMQGKITLSANLMGAMVKRSQRYDYKVTQLDDSVCAIDFYQDGQVAGQSVFTIQDARRAGTKNLDKFPRNMLFARAMSNGVRWYCPDVLGGSPVYTPEELGAEVDEEGRVIEHEPSRPVVTETRVVETQPTSSLPPTELMGAALNESRIASHTVGDTVPHPDNIRADGTFTEGALTYIMKGAEKYVDISPNPDSTAWALASATIGSRKESDRKRTVAKVMSLFVHESGVNKGKHNEFELSGSLKKHFGKAKVEALTFEELAALLQWKLHGRADPRWYADKLDAPKVEDVSMFDQKAMELAGHYGVDLTHELAPSFLTALSQMADPLYFKGYLYGQCGWSWATHASELDALAQLVTTAGLELGSQDFIDTVDTYLQNVETEHEPTH